MDVACSRFRRTMIQFPRLALMARAAIVSISPLALTPVQGESTLAYQRVYQHEVLNVKRLLFWWRSRVRAHGEENEYFLHVRTHVHVPPELPAPFLRPLIFVLLINVLKSLQQGNTLRPKASVTNT